MRRSILILILALISTSPAIAADCNGNGIEDSKESQIRVGDFDYDADVDLDDYAFLAANLAGPGEPVPNQQCAEMLLEAFDADGDDDLDLKDFAAFQNNFTGQHEAERYLRYATGYPDHVEWVDFGWVMDAYDATQPGIWGISAFEFTVSEPTVITGFAGVGGGVLLNLKNHVVKVNLHSDLKAFAADPKNGFSSFIATLVTTDPPIFGHPENGPPWDENVYLQYEFEPFLLEPDVPVVISLYHEVAAGRDLFFAESTQDFGSAWIMRDDLCCGIITYKDDWGFATGTLGIDVLGYDIP